MVAKRSSSEGSRSRQRRRSSGEGSVYRRESDGRWVGTLDLGYLNGKRVRKPVYGRTEAEAIAKLRKLREEHDRGLNLLEKPRTIRQWFDEWLGDIKAHDGTRPSTLAMYRVIAEGYIIPVIGSVRLDKLTPSHVQRLIAAARTKQTRLGRPPSPATVRHAHTVLRIALNDAYRMELVTRNVASQVKAPPKERAKRPRLSLADARRFLRTIEGERLEALFVLAMFTGLRRGELLGLHWADVDLERAELMVRYSVQRLGGSLVLGEPKTASSQRTVAIPKLAVEHLRAHRARQDAERLELVDVWQANDLVFPSRVGTLMEPRNVNRRFYELRRRADLPWLRVHDLRHACATFMHAAGADVKTMMAVLGHTEIATTMDIYTDLLPEVRRAAADALDQLFGA